MKQCIICHKEKELDDFYTHSRMADGHLNKCKECCKAYARARDTREYDKQRYRKPDRYLKHKYCQIKTRCDGKGHGSYLGREYLSKDEWTEWCKKTQKTFMSLWYNWVESGYKRKLAPSVDRIDNSKGYTPDNMQWITQSQNSSKFCS